MGYGGLSCCKDGPGLHHELVEPYFWVSYVFASLNIFLLWVKSSGLVLLIRRNMLIILDHIILIPFFVVVFFVDVRVFLRFCCFVFDNCFCSVIFCIHMPPILKTFPIPAFGDVHKEIKCIPTWTNITLYLFQGGNILQFFFINSWQNKQFDIHVFITLYLFLKEKNINSW